MPHFIQNATSFGIDRATQLIPSFVSFFCLELQISPTWDSLEMAYITPDAA